MALFQLILAAVVYAVGGLFMKLSAGLTRPAPTAAFILLFVFGSAIQALGMRQSELGVSYIFVLGAEVLVATAISVWYLQEHWSLSRALAVVLVVAGMVLLRRS
jgi:quaternary ammonium compound-resistance protein SugE